MTEQAVIATGAPGAAQISTSRFPVILGVVTLGFIAAVTLWTFRFWSMLAEASPILADFEQRLGPFDVHNRTHLVEAERLLDPIDGISAAYGPVWFLGGMFTLAAGFVLIIANLATDTAWSRPLATATMTALIVSATPLVLYGGDLLLLTDFLE